jgi:hypothetical protein
MFPYAASASPLNITRGDETLPHSTGTFNSEQGHLFRLSAVAERYPPLLRRRSGASASKTRRLICSGIILPNLENAADQRGVHFRQFRVLWSDGYAFAAGATSEHAVPHYPHTSRALLRAANYTTKVVDDLETGLVDINGDAPEADVGGVWELTPTD